MRKHTTFIILITLLFFSCKKKVVVVAADPWKEIPNLSLNSTINRLHSTGNEMLIGTIDNFARMNINGTVTERRELEVLKGVFGRPVLADKVFARVVKNVENRRELQFHLTKSINQIYRITDKEIADSAEFIIFEELPNAYSTGAFNSDGSQFLYAARSLNPQEARYVFFLFDIQLKNNDSQFQSVTVTHRIDIPASLLGEEASKLTNVRFFGGNYYVTTLSGAYRIQPNGEWQQIFSHWIWDIFEYEGTLYSTGFYENQFYKSDDNGENWEYANTSTPLRKVVVTGGKIFGQNQLGLPYRLATEDFTTLQEISYNSNFFDDEPTAYQAIQFFNGKYYISVHKRLYAVKDIVLK
ncbi:MAG TPA: hypothetical protein ENJ53_05595 [Phaeodactylibacter sp.]|nr:hypothetical protein [Phaeodactylibacter sp.]